MKNLIVTILISSVLVFTLMANVSVDSGNTTELSAIQMQNVSGGNFWSWDCLWSISTLLGGLATSYTIPGAMTAAHGVIGIITGC